MEDISLSDYPHDFGINIKLWYYYPMIKIYVYEIVGSLSCSLSFLGLNHYGFTITILNYTILGGLYGLTRDHYGIVVEGLPLGNQPRKWEILYRRRFIAGKIVYKWGISWDFHLLCLITLITRG